MVVVTVAVAIVALVVGVFIGVVFGLASTLPQIEELKNENEELQAEIEKWS
jgi:uncharacterized membrane-anchored protein YhcB (DUF1043 family)